MNISARPVTSPRLPGSRHRPLFQFRGGLLGEGERDDVRGDEGVRASCREQMDDSPRNDFCLAGRGTGYELQVPKGLANRKLLIRSEIHGVGKLRRSLERQGSPGASYLNLVV